MDPVAPSASLHSKGDATPHCHQRAIFGTIKNLRIRPSRAVPHPTGSVQMLSGRSERDENSSADGPPLSHIRFSARSNIPDSARGPPCLETVRNHPPVPTFQASGRLAFCRTSSITRMGRSESCFFHWYADCIFSGRQQDARRFLPGTLAALVFAQASGLYSVASPWASLGTEQPKFG